MRRMVRFTDDHPSISRWGRGADPRGTLVIGQLYRVVNVEIHSYHTLYYLEGYGEPYNSCHFEDS